MIPACKQHSAALPAMVGTMAATPERHVEQSSEDEIRPSRTQRKLNDQALQELGQALVSVSDDKLAELGLPERLREAIMQARTISKFGALRRQMQYIGRLMREEGDANSIRDQLNAWKGASVQETARLHLIERWRVQLLKDDRALEELIAEYPQADVQRIRMLIRNTRRESEAQKPPKSFRELFQVLREILATKPT